jgi:hypothetical protein
MTRRDFNLGVLLATGVAFIAKNIAFNPPKATLDALDRGYRQLRLFSLSKEQAQKCKIVFVRDDDESFIMPEIKVMIQNRGAGEIKFESHEINITEKAVFIGVRFIDDEGFEITDGVTKFSRPVCVTNSDVMRCSYSFKVT